MRCHEVAFTDAVCRIQIAQAPGPSGLSGFTARLFRLGHGRREMHPLTTPDGRPIEVHGRTESAALVTAIAFLADRYGGLTEYAHACEDFGDAPVSGTAILVPDPIS